MSSNDTIDTIIQLKTSTGGRPEKARADLRIQLQNNGKSDMITNATSPARMPSVSAQSLTLRWRHMQESDTDKSKTQVKL